MNCSARGAICVSQEFPEEDAPLPAAQTSHPQLVERMGRVEGLLEQLLGKIQQYEEEKHAYDAEVIETHNDSSTSKDVPGGFETGGVAPQGVGLPILSMFDNSAVRLNPWPPGSISAELE